MVARIFKPAKTAMQSGRAKANKWVLQHEREIPRKIEPLMGYTSSQDMKQQINLSFNTKEEAVAYAKRNGLQYRIMPAKTRTLRPVSYADNFKYTRTQAWTH